MNATEIKQKLIDLDACREAREWADRKTLSEIWEQCPRGDWMLWLARRAGVDKRTMTAAKADCAATIKHLMKDPRSIKALETAQAYGRGEATDDELADAADAADAAAAAAGAAGAAYAAADAAADAADAAADAAAAAAAASAAADAAYDAAADADAYAARKQSQIRTAEIVRSIITIEMLQL